MSGENNTGPQTPEGQQPPEGDSFQAITSQEDLDKIVGQRLTRERAKFADYDDLKAKASKFDEAETANKSELQKAIDRAEKAEKRAEKAELSGLRAEVARTKNVPMASITGTTKEEMEASADELIAWRDGDKARQQSSKPPSNLQSGASGGDDNLTGKERAAAALRQMRRT